MHLAGPDDDENITLLDADGNETRCRLLDAITVDGLDYVVVTPAEDEEESRLVVLRLSEDEGSARVSVIQDDAEFDRVVAYIYETARDCESLEDDLR